MEIEYYHRPFNIPDSSPLTDCVITMSTYSDLERDFLRHLIEKLGGISQEKLARITIVGDVKASTHLLSPIASGKKYEAALKWKLPVVDKNWLLECARTGTRVLEKNHLIGNSIGETFLLNFFLFIKTFSVKYF